MDAEELEEGGVVCEDDQEELKDGEVDDGKEDELEEGEVVDSDTDPGGEVTGDEEEDNSRGYGGVRLPSLLCGERQKQGELCNEPHALLGGGSDDWGKGVSLKYPNQ